MKSEKQNAFAKLTMLRRSVRRYEERAVEREKILSCIEAARVAPSACNSQPWHFVVVENAEARAKIASFAENRLLKMNLFVKSAPVIIVAVTEPSNFNASMGAFLKHKKYNVMDVSMAVEHLCLQAADIGLGTCILGWFNERKIKKLLGIPRRKKVHMIVTMGYPADGTHERKKNRKKLEDIVSFEKYSSGEKTHEGACDSGCMG
jgi:nitroreductase